MAMTKRFKVSFEVTTVIDSEGEQNLKDHILDIAQRVAAGEEVNPFKQEMLVQALTYGPEGLSEFIIKSGLRELVKDAHRELCEDERRMMSFSPAEVEVIR